MKELLELKKRLQSHQSVNKDMVDWAKERSTNQCVEHWRATVQECDFILYLINNLIEETKKKEM